MENFFLSSTPLEISEFPNHKEATFLISVLDEYNSNGVLIEKNEGKKYHSTIVGYPILAYLKYDKKGKPKDFGGHELRAKYNSETKEIDYYFATHPIGSVTDSWIEEREIDGYEGKKHAILIKAKLWKSRFPEYFNVFDKLWDSGNISSSWEISSSETEKTSKGKKLKAFEFIGNCILGSNVKGAVNGAGVLEVASNDNINFDLSNAFLEDIQVTELDNDDKGGEPMGEKNELSALTSNDLYKKIRKAVNALDENKYYYISMVYPYEFKLIAYTWDRESEEDFVEIVYSVNSDETISITSQKDVKMTFVPKDTIESQVAELNDKLDKAEKEIASAGKSLTDLGREKETLEAQVQKLQPFKEKVEALEKAEQDRVLAEKTEELKAFALEDELITSEELDSDETVAAIFSELTLDNYETSQEKLEVIKGKRAIAKFKETKLSSNQGTIETSQFNDNTNKVKSNLNGEEDGTLSAVEIVKSILIK